LKHQRLFRTACKKKEASYTFFSALAARLFQDELWLRIWVDGHEIGKIPGIGFKLAQKLRAHVLQREPAFDSGLVYGGTRENVHVATVRKHAGIDAETLEQILGGPGT
jgi:hypothetical protein